MPNEPTIADVLARLDRLDQAVTVLSLEERAGRAELKLDITGLRQLIHDLDRSMRDLWSEHLGHSHPEEAE